MPHFHDMTETSKGHALVTGAAKRIGREIAAALAEDGWTVGIHHRRSADDADALCRYLTEAGNRAYVVAADLDDDADIDRLVVDAVAAGGPITCLVNNASVFEHDSLETLSRQSWDTHMNVNLWAPIKLSQALATGLPDGETGNIINIADQRVINIPPGFLSYTISKTGMWAMTQNLALALAPRVRVNAIGPGPTLPSPRQSQEQFDKQAARVPLGRGAGAGEIADGVRYILAAPSLTGQMIALDGGQHLGWEFPEPGAPPVTE
ncbi:MAG: NAD(P)-dependent dehydrogenase (short-subunit alcohol dehydrogenase family) [Paracoccaceae bacterium]|jgi:NAD(P)-dependent dehydrogenase (short-subunit alcohol dehydrogenase family)